MLRNIDKFWSAIQIFSGKRLIGKDFICEQDNDPNPIAR